MQYDFLYPTSCQILAIGVTVDYESGCGGYFGSGRGTLKFAAAARPQSWRNRALDARR